MLLANTSSLPSRSNYVFSQGGYPIGSPEPTKSYWAVRMDDGKWWCEMDEVSDLLIGHRNLDWSLDICGPSGDWKHIKELWMICPPTYIAPAGNTARLPITTPGTSFQLKVGVVDSSLAVSLRRPLAQMIGRVVDVETGDCEVFCYDYAAQALCVYEEGIDNEGKPVYGPWRTNVYNMGKWRPDIPGTPQVAPITNLNFEVVGLHLS